MGAVAPVPLLHRVRGVALARAGDRPGAADALRQSLEAARVNQVDYEVALTLKVMAALGLDDGGRAPEDLARESDRILESLGVVWVPDLLEPGVRRCRLSALFRPRSSLRTSGPSSRRGHGE